MNRRTAIGTAVAVVLVVLSASAALALNVGIIEQSVDESVDAATGPPSSTTAVDPEIVVEYVDVYEDGTEVPAGSSTPAAPAAAAPVGGTGGGARSPQTAPSPSSSTAAPSGPRYETVVVDGVAEVTVAVHGSSDMEFWSVVPIGAWQYAVEDLRGDEIEIEFRSSSREVELKLTLVGGELRSFVEAEDDEAAGDDHDDGRDDEDHDEGGDDHGDGAGDDGRDDEDHDERGDDHGDGDDDAHDDDAHDDDAHDEDD